MSDTPENTLTAPRPFCFVLMPFNAEFDDVYQIGIKEACESAGAYSERVDEQIFHESILERVFNQIAKADLIVADMTGRNANVFYEVGYAHALGKRTILLTQSADDIPFDLKHFPHIVYGTSITSLRDNLKTRVQYFVENPAEAKTTDTIDIELFVGEQNLASGNAVIEYGKSQFPHANITIRNTSATTFEPGDFRLGIISAELSDVRGKESLIETTPLPDGSYLHMCPDFPVLFPQAFASYLIVFQFPVPRVTDVDLVCRVFTRIGTRDFPLHIREQKDG